MNRLAPLLLLLIACATGCAFDASGLPADPVPVADAGPAIDPPADAASPSAADAAVDAAPPVERPDAAPRPGRVGDVCTENVDCASGACESVGGGVKQCAARCGLLEPECPDDFECKGGVCVAD